MVQSSPNSRARTEPICFRMASWAAIGSRVEMAAAMRSCSSKLECSDAAAELVGRIDRPICSYWYDHRPVRLKCNLKLRCARQCLGVMPSAQLAPETRETPPKTEQEDRTRHGRNLSCLHSGCRRCAHCDGRNHAAHQWKWVMHWVARVRSSDRKPLTSSIRVALSPARLTP